MEFNQTHPKQIEQPKEAQTKVIEDDVHEEIVLIETEEITIDVIESSDKNETEDTQEGFWNLEENCLEENNILNFSFGNAKTNSAIRMNEWAYRSDSHEN